MTVAFALMVLMMPLKNMAQKRGQTNMESPIEIEWGSNVYYEKFGYLYQIHGNNDNYILVSSFPSKKSIKKTRKGDFSGMNLKFIDKNSLDNSDMDVIPVFKDVKQKGKDNSTTKFYEIILFKNSVAVIFENSKRAKGKKRSVKKYKYFANIYSLEGKLLRSKIDLGNKSIKSFRYYTNLDVFIKVEDSYPTGDENKKEFAESKPRYEVSIMDTTFQTIFTKSIKIDEPIETIEPIKNIEHDCNSF